MIQLLKNKIYKKKLIPEKGIITFLNPYSYLLARKRKSLYESFDGIFIDGVVLKWLLRLVIKENIERVSFDMTSLAPKVFDYCISNNRTIAFVGTTQDSLSKFISQVERDYKHLKIVYSRDGYLGKDYDKTIWEIVGISPDFVVVGMGTPLQDEFLVDLKKCGYQGVGFTCGGFFHQSSNQLDYYPSIFNKLNLRWLYRMLKEKKTIKRYLIWYPVAILLFFKDVLIVKRFSN